MYLLISIKNIIGMQFYLLLGPFLFPLLACIKREVMKLYFYLSLGYSFILSLFIVVLINLPLEKLSFSPHHATIVMRSEPLSVCKKFNEFNDYEIYTDYYATAALLTYVCKKNIQVLFSGSRYGREFDKWVNLNEVGSKVLFFQVWGDIEKKKKYFTNYQIDSFTVYNASFDYLLGENFDIVKYKNEFDSKVKKRYFTVPNWLPQKKCEIL